ncbi:hypothetical protein EHS13_29145 [Paenibacillus psychroresistens]|uniref:WD40 repeat domain-containing protein n=1 Tax=Paenibacillus psychroresistens TaxID=1778678 RepID=A0A6B8RQK6_9BACL|nr:PD40 domain-containing protein [Paenibacillus psychroresistens]QGQ98660.1 hypothetical protein EHS13_29145 [Paenibacillus psychroresistens]
MKLKIGMIIALLICTACQSKEADLVTDVKPETTVKPKTEIAVAAQTPQTKKEFKLEELIPQGRKIATDLSGEPLKAEGDLNKDGIEDLVFIVDSEAMDVLENRDLAIYLGEKDGSYTKSIYAKSIIMCKNCGGGGIEEPVQDLAVDRGSVVLNSMWGSSTREYENARFQLRDKLWLLIGYTSGIYSIYEETASQRDFNLITGDYILKAGKSMDILKTISSGKNSPRKLVELVNYVGDPDNEALSKLSNNDHIEYVTESPNRKYVFYIYYDNGTHSTKEVPSRVYVKQLDAKDPIELKDVDDSINSVVWSPDGNYLLVGLVAGDEHKHHGNLYKASSMETLKSINYYGDVTFSPDSTRIVYSSDDLADTKVSSLNLEKEDERESLVIYDSTTNDTYSIVDSYASGIYFTPFWNNKDEIAYVVESMIEGVVTDQSIIKVKSGKPELKPKVSSIYPLYENEKGKFSFEFPKEWENKYAIKEYQSGITILHKNDFSTKGELFGVFEYGSVDEWKEFLIDQPSGEPYVKLGVRDGRVFVKKSPGGEVYDTNTLLGKKTAEDYFKLLEQEASIIETFKFTD